MDSRAGDPPPTSVPYFTVEAAGEHVPHVYLGVVLATGASGYEAVDALEGRALDTARREHARIDDPSPSRHTYAVVGLRIAAGMASSGQPEWLAYGTLLRMRHDPPARHAQDL